MSVRPVSRTDPCPCGSGRRYKHCCGAAGALAPKAEMPAALSADSFVDALALHQAGRIDEAERIYRRILDAHPASPHVLHYLGVCCLQRGQHEAAARHIRAALESNDREPMARNNLGLVYKEQNRLEDALACFDAALDQDPANALAYNNRGLVLIDLRRLDDAIRDFTEAVRLRGDFAEAFSNLGKAFLEQQHYAEALASCDQAIALNPALATAHAIRGSALGELERYDEAFASWDRAIALKPDFAEVHSSRATALAKLGRHDEAFASWDRAIALNPDFAAVPFNRGNTLHALNRLEEALESYDRALGIKPDYAEALNNRGNVLSDLKRFPEAMSSFERAIELDANLASAHWNLALCHLQLGDFAPGWRGYEWRWNKEPLQKVRRAFAQPLWLGVEPLVGKTILLHSEQGLGDTLQFCRYARMVAALGAKVVLEVQPPLLPLLAGLGNDVEVLPKGSALPAFDCHCPLLSLPLAFGTELHTVPAGPPYIRSDPARAGAWEAAMGRKSRPRIGIVWSGSVGLENDRNRSLALAQMLPLLSYRAEWVSLQKEVRRTDADLLAAHTEIRHFGNALKDFADTAVLVELMDLVVTVDTGVAHLAGAMGKPVWILLPFSPDWRWLLDREDSVWYPTARLFRQTAIGDWASVIDRVGVELAKRYRWSD